MMSFTETLQAKSPVSRELSMSDGLNSHRQSIDYEDIPDSQLTLCDFSLFARTSVKGHLAATQLSASGYPLPSQINQSVCGTEGELILQLGPSEFWILNSSTCSQTAFNITQSTGCYLQPSQASHAWFSLRGEQAAECMAKLCGVDLRSSSHPQGTIAQTSVARITTVVIRHPEEAEVFFLLCGQSSAEYLWRVLNDAMTEFGGIVSELTG